MPASHSIIHLININTSMALKGATGMALKGATTILLGVRWWMKKGWCQHQITGWGQYIDTNVWVTERTFGPQKPVPLIPKGFPLKQVDEEIPENWGGTGTPTQVHLEKNSYYNECRYNITQTRHRLSTSTRWHFAFALWCHSNETRAPIANPPNTAQLRGTPTIPPSYIRVHTGRHRHTHVRDQYTLRVVYDSHNT